MGPGLAMVPSLFRCGFREARFTRGYGVGPGGRRALDAARCAREGGEPWNAFREGGNLNYLNAEAFRAKPIALSEEGI